jgi:hypothetical protein
MVSIVHGTLPSATPPGSTAGRLTIAATLIAVPTGTSPDSGRSVRGVGLTRFVAEGPNVPWSDSILHCGISAASFFTQSAVTLQPTN